MVNETPQFKLNSYNEWGKLKEVIVGNPFPSDSVLVDYSFCHFNFDNINEHLDIISKDHLSQDSDVNRIHYRTQYLSELKEDIDELVNTLSSNGISVLRPKQIETHNNSVTTPYWTASIWPALNVRDRFLVLGSNIVETPPCIRARYFETDLLKPILYPLFTNGAMWYVMPKPIMTDTSFDKTYIDGNINKTASREFISSRQVNYYDLGPEIMMDAANCLRVGKDILVNVSDKNQYLAYKWLERCLGSTFHFHMLDSVTDNHIDSYIIIIRPGLVMVRNKGVLTKLPASMRTWKYIIAPEAQESIFPQYESDSLVITSKYIDTNILSLDENKVIANSLNIELMRLLELNGVEVIPVRHRHRRLFGGGFHCFTLDLNRESECISYLS